MTAGGKQRRSVVGVVGKNWTVKSSLSNLNLLQWMPSAWRMLTRACYLVTAVCSIGTSAEP
jgi:hypothetical protein